MVDAATGQVTEAQLGLGVKPVFIEVGTNDYGGTAARLQ